MQLWHTNCDYALISYYDNNLNYIDGYRYFSGNVKDKKQRFNDAVTTQFGNVIGIGYSNYYNIK